MSSTSSANPRDLHMPVMRPRPFPDAAHEALADTQLRRNLRKATSTIRTKRAAVVDELDDWQALRRAGRQIKDRVLRHLDAHLEQLEAAVVAAGGQVHWARDGQEANRIIVDLVRATGAEDVVKVKSLTTDEIEMNAALADAGIAAWETDLAELIVQLGEDLPSHILVPAIHRNRAEIMELFRRRLGVADLTDEPAELAAAARTHLRERFLSTRVGISGANFAVADTGTVCVVESEGNGRMCLTLPETLITLMGIEKVVPTWQDMEVFLQLLPRSSTGERMNPYTSMWSGVTPGDGPQAFHLVLLDNGRTDVLADGIGRQTLRCIRCSACMNVCPVYERVGGHAYGSVYPGPIGAILTPQLHDIEQTATLPYASSLCGACYEVCPVEIDIPEVLVHLRNRVVEHKRTGGGLPSPEALSMRALGWIMADRGRYEAALRAATSGGGLSRSKVLRGVPGPLRGWTAARDLPEVPRETFRQWWARRGAGRGPGDGATDAAAHPTDAHAPDAHAPDAVDGDAHGAAS